MLYDQIQNHSTLFFSSFEVQFEGDAKMAAEKKLTTPTTPNPTPPITTHRLQAINSLVIRRPIFSKAIAC